MDTPTPVRPGFQLFRRDFLVGTLAGVVGSAAGEYLAPLEWKLKTMPEGAQLSFSQAGEDMVVLGLLKYLKIEKPSYMDVGAFHPTIGSNTYLMYRLGGRGVLIEPNVDMIPDLKGKRPGDTVLNIGIGLDDTPETDYYVMNYPQLNTFDADEAKRRERDSGGKTVIKQIVKMPLVNINKVIVEHFPEGSPDFLSIDTEGLDLIILKTMDYAKHRPKLICAETMGDEGIRMIPAITEFLASKDYVVRGMTLANTIYIDKKLLG
ncbi:FkbM family methyltransferase [Zavarzinella formosa]|uniref:FkbM family methyltransferase n=1 Tax=Zavarzinella formosa TaxID=360055 RepID=UPI0003181EFA|nr:FkbM family methyltransferase [Zavarzinella formosa]